MKKLYIYTYLLWLTVIFACQPTLKYVNSSSSLKIDSTSTSNQKAEILIAPYKSDLDAEMNEVLVISAEEFPKEKGKTQTKLGNLVADLSLEIAQGMYNDSIDFCLLNFGGLRTSLPKGEITRGKIFELMPFENELVVVTLPKIELYSIKTYLYRNGCQPISGTTMVLTDGSQESSDIKRLMDDPKSGQQIKVLTSDYLAKGGDNMTFFANPIKYEKVGIKLRDAIIKFCITEHNKGNQLKGVIDNRLTIQGK